MKVDSIPGIEVRLRAENKNLQEYDDNADELCIPNIARRFVEAVTGAEFQIELKLNRFTLIPPNRLDSVACLVHLDGVYATGAVADINDAPCVIVNRTENVAGRFYKRTMNFAELVTDDTPVKHIKPESVANLGEVKVECTWFRKAGPPIPALKGRAVSHTTKLGDRKPCAASNEQPGTYPYGVKPFATYIFKYRSKRTLYLPASFNAMLIDILGDLQIEGVLPRTPSPLPLEERDPDSLTAEEARELVRQMRATQKDNVQVKREKRERSGTALNDDDEDEDDAHASSESRSRKRQRRSTDSAIDVVDLTDD
ncbi:hypothetical protein LTR15_006835 [Elasticomyces elasticus]|nr:hypothetical protein LTR15_006835 [Elasticomyces elasticus]